MFDLMLLRFKVLHLINKINFKVGPNDVYDLDDGGLSLVYIFDCLDHWGFSFDGLEYEAQAEIVRNNDWNKVISVISIHTK